MKVLLAMSGGVDSSMCVKLLKDAGYEVQGCYMQLHDKPNYHEKNIKNVIFEIPLLFNAGYDKLFSFTIGVEAKNETRLKYLSDRDADNYNNQNNISKSNKYAENRNKLDYIISNEGSIEDLNNQVKEIYSKILNS